MNSLVAKQHYFGKEISLYSNRSSLKRKPTFGSEQELLISLSIPLFETLQTPATDTDPILLSRIERCSWSQCSIYELCLLIRELNNTQKCLLFSVPMRFFFIT